MLPSKSSTGIELAIQIEQLLLNRLPTGWTRAEIEDFFAANRLLVEEAADGAICENRRFQVQLFFGDSPNTGHGSNWVLTDLFEHEDDADLAGHMATLELNDYRDITAPWAYWVVPSILPHRSKDSWDRDNAVSFWIELQVGNRWITDGVRVTFLYVEPNRRELLAHFPGGGKTLVHGSTQAAGAAIQKIVPQGQYLRYTALVGANRWSLGQVGYAARPSLDLLHKQAEASIRRTLYQADSVFDNELQRQFGKESSTARYRPELDDERTAAARKRVRDLRNYDLYESVGQFVGGRWETTETKKIAEGDFDRKRQAALPPAEIIFMRVGDEPKPKPTKLGPGQPSLGELLALFHGEARTLTSRLFGNPGDYPEQLVANLEKLGKRIVALAPAAKRAVKAIEDTVDDAADADDEQSQWEKIEGLFAELRQAVGRQR